MQLTVTTWNINSVRLRIDLVAKFIKAARPDIICLQETKCPDDRFPLKRFKRLGYENVALNGQKGYHGVVVLSRLPFESTAVRVYCGKSDCRHISIVLGEHAGLKDPITLHNFYVPAGGDVPDPAVNAKFAHKLAFLDEMQACATLRPAPVERAIIVGDLNVAPLECDVWSHKQLLSVVSHTPIECEKLLGVQKAGNWIDAVRSVVPEPTKLFTWWSYRARDWTQSDRGRRLDHIWTSPALADRLAAVKVLKDSRGWARPSDHVPVTATWEV
ncbi:MAG TPA: exodeoxyribonuclease III [Xanthobacteraceae bacterium]|nr:exodeoxyribonuclease III [Xanthobacteraceae bacterium]